MSRKAFIYGLEIAAQIVALVSFCHRLPTGTLGGVFRQHRRTARIAQGLRPGHGGQWDAGSILDTGGTAILATGLRESDLKGEYRRRGEQSRPGPRAGRRMDQSPHTGQPDPHRHGQGGQGHALRLHDRRRGVGTVGQFMVGLPTRDGGRERRAVFVSLSATHRRFLN